EMPTSDAAAAAIAASEADSSLFAWPSPGRSDPASVAAVLRTVPASESVARRVSEIGGLDADLAAEGWPPAQVHCPVPDRPRFEWTSPDCGTRVVAHVLSVRDVGHTVVHARAVGRTA